MRKIFVSIFIIFYVNNLFSNEEININFKEIQISDLIKVTSKITKKNILMPYEINEKINFIPTQKITKSNLLNILKIVLKENGYLLIERDNVLKVKKNDNLDEQNHFTNIVQLKNVDAQNIVKILNDIINNSNLYKKAKPFVSFDLESNSLILIGKENELEKLRKIVEKLDKEKAQVYVQAKIVEVNNELINKVGISYGLISSASTADTLGAISSNLNGGSSAIKEAVDTLGIKISDLNIKSGLALGASLNLLKRHGALDIISEPSILAIDNQESLIYVGEKISIQISNSISDGGTQRSNFQREDVGLTLKVKPRISSDIKLTLQINALLEGLKSNSVSAGQNPDTLKKEIKTTAILNNGESVIIGGLIENKNEISENKIPILGDIPLIGRLFTNSVKINKKNNLVIIVTPYMIPKSKNITYIRDQLSKLKNLENKYLEDSLKNINNINH